MKDYARRRDSERSRRVSGGTWRKNKPSGLSQGELPHSGKRGWPGPFVHHQSFLELFKGPKNLQLGENTSSAS